MKISCNWLRELIPTPETPEALGGLLTMVGLAVDGIEACGDDHVLELDITANRGDCLSHLGVARELAAIRDRVIRLPDGAVDETDTPAGEVFRVAIEDAGRCGRYAGRYLEGVRVAPSPAWLARRLEAVGVRSINNVADATNYVLMELGHPLHAFDADRLAGRAIVVRRAAEGETLTTLDGVERRLDPSVLVIADAARPVALAGVMGGEATEISSATTNVFLESAWFEPLSIRKTARQLRMSTEASYRFERGADIAMVEYACDRTARLIQELAGGVVYRGAIDVYPEVPAPVRVRLRRGRIRGRLGLEVPDEDVVRILACLGFIKEEEGLEGWVFQTPSHRHDVRMEEDLLEEIARHYGYDRFPSTLPAWAGQGRRLPRQREEDAVRAVLEGLGYSETCSLVFSDEPTERRFTPDAEVLVLRNPLSEDAPVLRTSLASSMLRSLQWNLNRGARDLMLYEIGKVYPASGERRRLILAATGALTPPGPHGARIEAGFYPLKGDVEALLERFNAPRDASVDGLPEHYHPGRSVRLGPAAVLGELARGPAEAFKLRPKVYLAEIDIEKLYESGLRKVAVTSIPKYPAIRRDLSLLLDRRIRYADVVAAIDAARIAELVHVEAFDRMERGPFPDACYSLGLGLVYQAADRTLTDEEVQEFDRRVLSRLEGIGAKLRT